MVIYRVDDNSFQGTDRYLLAAGNLTTMDQSACLSDQREWLNLPIQMIIHIIDSQARPTVTIFTHIVRPAGTIFQNRPKQNKSLLPAGLWTGRVDR